MPRFNWHWIHKIAKGKGEWLTLLFSLLLALFIWTVHNLSLRYTTYVQYSLHVKTKIEGRVMEADAIDDIMVRVRASGYALISHYLEESLILELDPKFLRPLSADSDTFLVYVSEVKDIIEKKLLEESISSVENFTTEFVRVILPKIDTKKVPVVAQSEVKYYPQYMATSQMKLTPDSVLIYGEDALVEKTDAVYTKVISGQNVSESFQGVASVIPVEGLTMSQTQVYYSQEVGRYIEHSVELPLELVNVPKEKELLPLTSKVILTYRQLLSSHKAYDASEFKCVLNYNEVAESINHQVVPHLTKLPSGIYSISFEPPYIDCIVLDRQ